MTDLTPLFSTLLTSAGGAAIPLNRRCNPPSDKFLQEAYKISNQIAILSSNLQKTRQAYLFAARAPANRFLAVESSSTSFTDDQRKDLDEEIKTTIRAILAYIEKLEAAEHIRVATEARLFKQRHSTLKSLWEDDSVRNTEMAAMKIVTAHREAVMWFLKNRLEKASEDQRKRQEILLNREREKSKNSLLHKEPVMKGLAGGAAAFSGDRAGKIAVEEEEERAAVEALSPDQLRIFEKENEGMLKHYEDMLEQVRIAESSLYEISELQTQLATEVAMQNEHIEDLTMDSLTTAEDIERGNKELKKAAEKSSVARSVFLGTVMFCSVVFVWDWFI